MILLIGSIVFSLLLFDFALVGFMPKVLKIWPPLSEIKEDILIEDTAYYSIKTDMQGRFVDPMINNRICYKSILLTSYCLLVKNTILTYLLRINIEDINSYTVEQKILGKKITLYLTVKGEDRFFQFRTKKSDKWIETFLNIGLKQKQ